MSNDTEQPEQKVTRRVRRKPLRLLTTDAQIQAVAQVRSGHREAYRISGVQGLKLEIREGGAMTWVLRYKTKAGKPRAHPIGRYDGPQNTVRMSLAEARKAAKAARARVDLGGDPQAERIAARRAEEEAQRRGDGTIESLGRRCLDALKLKPKVRSYQERMFRVEIVKAFGTKPATELTRAEIRAWGARIANRAPIVANRAFELLRRIYSWSMEQDLLNGTPFVKLKKPSPERESDRVLSTEEIRVVWKAIAELEVDLAEGRKRTRRKRAAGYGDAKRLLWFTGVRLDMVVEMRLSEIEGLAGDVPRWVIPAEKVKSDRPHVVPFSRQAVAIVRRRVADGLTAGDVVFPPVRVTKSGKPVMTWTSRWVGKLDAKVEEIRAREAAKADPPQPAPPPVPRWTIHNLRHTLGTHMREDLKIEKTVVSKILIHAVHGASVTRIYDRSELLDERRAALQAWADWIEAL